jgi:hypothetical protein
MSMQIAYNSDGTLHRVHHHVAPNDEVGSHALSGEYEPSVTLSLGTANLYMTPTQAERAVRVLTASLRAIDARLLDRATHPLPLADRLTATGHGDMGEEAFDLGARLMRMGGNDAA